MCARLPDKTRHYSDFRRFVKIYHGATEFTEIFTHFSEILRGFRVSVVRFCFHTKALIMFFHTETQGTQGSYG